MKYRKKSQDNNKNTVKDSPSQKLSNKLVSNTKRNKPHI